MASSSSESRPGEMTPLLASTASQHEEIATACHESQTLEDSNGIIREPYYSRSLLLLGFSCALGLALATSAVLLTRTLLETYGNNRFGFKDWNMEEERGFIFWVTLGSTVLAMANIVNLRCNQNPLPDLFNTVFLGIGAFFLIPPVAVLFFYEAWSKPTYCREETLYPVHYLDSRSDPLQECQVWAAKIEAVTLSLLFTAGFQGIILAGLLIAVISNMLRYLACSVMRLLNSTRLSSRLSSGQVSFEVSLRWGESQHQNQFQRRPEQGDMRNGDNQSTSIIS